MFLLLLSQLTTVAFFCLAIFLLGKLFPVEKNQKYKPKSNHKKSGFIVFK